MDAGKYERVERRAYALWKAEGQPHGRHEEHWHRAMREIEIEETASAVVKRTAKRKKSKD
jgi:hypothetical protein